MSIITNNQDAIKSKIIRVRTPFEMMLPDALAEYRSLNGGQFQNLTFAFEVGCLMADYHLIVDDAAWLADNDGAKDHFAPLENLTFANEDDAVVLPEMTTIGVFDRRNKRMAYVVVIAPGYNMVYFTRTQLDSTHAEIDLISTDTTRAANRIYNYWRDGSNFAKVMVATLFGYEYDEKDDELYVPNGRTENAFEQSKKIAFEIRQARMG